MSVGEVLSDEDIPLWPSGEGAQLIIATSVVQVNPGGPNMVIWCNWKAYSPAKVMIQVQDLLLLPTSLA